MMIYKDSSNKIKLHAFKQLKTSKKRQNAHKLHEK